MNLKGGNFMRIRSSRLFVSAMLSALLMVNCVGTAFAGTVCDGQIVYPAAISQESEFSLHDIRPGSGVSEIKWLSDYHSSLKGSPADTRVYVMEGKEDGPTLLLLGGTHGNEIAGIMTAILMVERANVEVGRLLVIPVANYSASTQNLDSMRPDITEFQIETPTGVRTFRYGGRRTNPKDQVPDEDQFIHYPSGTVMSGSESRNLNRVYPGKSDGTTTQQVAYAIMQIIDQEDVDIAMDMHEAGPNSGLDYCLIANPNVVSMGALAVLELADMGIDLALDFSNPNNIGLSHREWGDRTDVAAFLVETTNPAQEWKGLDVVPMNDGDPVGDSENPLEKRVAVELSTIECIFRAYEVYNGERPVLSNLPTYDELIENGVGYYMN